MGSTPSKYLLAAASAGDEAAIDAALRKGASVNCQDELRRTPLHAAAKYGRLAALQKLLRLRAYDLRDATGCTAMHYACEYGHNEVLKALIMHGSDVWALNVKMYRPVHLAYATRKTATVRLFEEMCCPFRAQIEVHRSQLFGMMASMQRRWAVVHRARRFDNPAVDRNAFLVNLFNSRESPVPEAELRNPRISDPTEVQRTSTGEVVSFTLTPPRGTAVRCRCARPVYNWLHMVLHPTFGAGSTPAVDASSGLVLEPAWQVAQNLYMPREAPRGSAPAPAPAAAPAPAPAAAATGGASGYPSFGSGSPAVRPAPSAPSAGGAVAGAGAGAGAGAATGSGTGGGFVGQFPGGGGTDPGLGAAGGGVAGGATPAAPAKTHEQEVGEKLAARFDELGLDDDDAPEEFMCPITYEVMNDPVIASDGHTYERASVLSWFAKGNMRSPKTGADMTTNTVFPNHGLRSRIIEWREEKIGAASKAQAREGPSSGAGGAGTPAAGEGAGAGEDGGIGATAPPAGGSSPGGALFGAGPPPSAQNPYASNAPPPYYGGGSPGGAPGAVAPPPYS